MNVAVIDIGSPQRNNIGWAIVGPLARTGADLDTGIEAFVEAVGAAPLALGFEAPMFVPMRDRPNDLTRARNGERNQAFSANVGATALVTGTVVVPYVLDRLRRAVADAGATLNWQEWLRGEAGGPQLLLFEAFVSNRGGSRNTKTRHVDDALAAAQALHAKLANGGNNRVVGDGAEKLQPPGSHDDANGLDERRVGPRPTVPRHQADETTR